MKKVKTIDFYQKCLNEFDKSNYEYLYHLPEKNRRFVTIDTKIMESKKEGQILSIGLCEMENGKLTGKQFQTYIHPKNCIEAKKDQLQNIYDEFEVYNYLSVDDNYKIETILKWLENSIIFAYDATIHMNIINNELFSRGFQKIPKERFRCSKRIFREIITKIDPLYSPNNISLKNCCKYFKLIPDDYIFCKTSFNSFLISAIVAKLYNLIEDNPIVYKYFYYYFKIKT